MIKVYVGFAFALLLLVPRGLHAYAVPQSSPITQTISNAKIIAVVRLVSLELSTKDKQTLKAPQSLTGPEAFIREDSIKPPSLYTFQVVQYLLGGGNRMLHLNLPAVMSYYYGESKFIIKPGDQYLLLLKPSISGELVPVDFTVPLIPVTSSSDRGSSLQKHDTDIKSQVLGYLVNSLTDSSIRAANLHLLKSVVDPRIVSVLSTYLNEVNVDVLSDILFCLAENQQVAVIPHIAMLEEKLSRDSNSTDAVLALRDYKTTEATPYLNPLLFSEDYSLRLNAMLALDNLSNNTSIPYLLLALRDPDPQKIIPGSAYISLYKVIPHIGSVPTNALGRAYFYDHIPTLTQPVYQWWSDELLGKHLKSGEHTALPAVIPDTPALLHPLLYVPDTATRRAAVTKLARIGDKSSIPYLILALQDPDAQAPDVSVSYVAYKTLHRLIPSLGAAQDSDSFTADHAAATQPIYHWWQDELLGKHSAK